MMKLYDLSHAYSDGMSVPEGMPQPRIETIKRVGVDRSNVTEFTLRTHMGTHMDAPYHYIPTGPHLDEVDIQRFTGRGYVIPAHKERLTPLHEEDIMALADKLRGIPFALFSFGWSKYFGTDEYYNHPYLAEDAAQALVALEVGCVGVDTITPDIPIPLRKPGYKGPAHLTLLGNNVLIIENVTGLEPLEGQDIEVYAFPLKLKNGDGGPVRLVGGVRE